MYRALEVALVWAFERSSLAASGPCLASSPSSLSRRIPFESFRSSIRCSSRQERRCRSASEDSERTRKGETSVSVHTREGSQAALVRMERFTSTSLARPTLRTRGLQVRAIARAAPTRAAASSCSPSPHSRLDSLALHSRQQAAAPEYAIQHRTAPGETSSSRPRPRPPPRPTSAPPSRRRLSTGSSIQPLSSTDRHQASRTTSSNLAARLEAVPTFGSHLPPRVFAPCRPLARPCCSTATTSIQPATFLSPSRPRTTSLPARAATVAPDSPPLPPPPSLPMP